MKLYPEYAGTSLGFDVVLNALSAFGETREVKEKLSQIQPIHDPGKIRQELVRVQAFQKLLSGGDFFPPNSFREISPWLKKCMPGNSVLTREEIHKVGLWLRSLKNVLTFLEQNQERFPELHALIPDLPPPQKLMHFIFRHLSEDGHMKDDATPELLRLRNALLDSAHKVRKLVDKIHRHARDMGWTDERQPALRNNRLVIPLSADFKGKVQGFIQDVSHSGQTLFLEPAEALSLNNEITEFTIKERNEVYRILSMMSAAIRDELPALKRWEYFMQYMEMLQAKARLSVRLQAEVPHLNASADTLSLVNARNPLLILNNTAAVVPLSLDLNREKNVLVISGPNAGGKSVSLKTLGLLQIMLQSGLPVPADRSSVFPVLASLMVDLGDGQSIENDLSTYTAHLKHMRYFLEHAHDSSLFLIDEFGTGTDPRAGGPIATAILEALLKSRAYGVITTHYSDLKDFARQHPSVLNASMLFNLSTFTPAYKLQMGQPGASYAFEIARRAGIPEYILENGKALMGTTSAGAEEIMAELMRDKEAIEQLKHSLRQQEHKAQTLLKKVEEREETAQAKARKIIADAREHTRNMILEASVKINAMVSEVREKQVEKKVAKSMQKELLQWIPELMPDLKEAEEKAGEVPEAVWNDLQHKEPVAGDTVRWLATGAVGIVLDTEGKKFTVAFGELRTTLKRKDIICVKQEIQGLTDLPHQEQYKTALLQKAMQASTVLDIRGQRAEAATELIRKFLDEAILGNVPYLHIIHGKGNGVLRKITHEILKTTFAVKSWKEASSEQGGAGATDISL